MKILIGILSIALTLTAFPVFAQDAEGESTVGPLTGIKGKKAPPLGVTTWINLPEGKERLGIPDFENKVVVVFCFQSTCVACEKREFPVLKQLVDEFEGNDNIAFVAVQTPFEDYASNSELKLKSIAEKHNLSIPFGHLAKTPETYSINVAYQTGGTPWWIVIDREGTVVFNDFTMAPDIAAANLKTLLAGESVE